MCTDVRAPMSAKMAIHTTLVGITVIRAPMSATVALHMNIKMSAKVAMHTNTK